VRAPAVIEAGMYQFSRAIYRELAPYVLEEKPGYQRETNRELVLRACERVMERLLTDRRHFAKPARTLFNEVRIYFSLTSQLRACMVIDRNIALALEFLSKLPEREFDANGLPRSCQAMTRRGSACQRQPLTGSDYCPSHQHLREDLEELAEAELVAA
jgi:hypothetical protein